MGKKKVEKKQKEKNEEEGKNKNCMIIKMDTHPVAMVMFFFILVDAARVTSAILSGNRRIKTISHLFLLLMVTRMLSNSIPTTLKIHDLLQRRTIFFSKKLT